MMARHSIHHTHTRGPAAEKLVTEAVVYAWNDTYPIRCRSELRATSVGSKLNVSS